MGVTSRECLDKSIHMGTWRKDLPWKEEEEEEGSDNMM